MIPLVLPGAATGKSRLPFPEIKTARSNSVPSPD